MQDAITNVINQADVQGLYLDTSSMGRLEQYFASGELRVRAAATLSANAAAIIKVGRHLEKIRSVLAQIGLSDNARYIERATMAEQRIVPLADVDDGDAPYFSMILVHKRAEAWK